MADLGFPRGGGANPEGGANLLFGQFFRKLHENEDILGQKGGASLAPHIDLPLAFFENFTPERD